MAQGTLEDISAPLFHDRSQRDDILRVKDIISELDHGEGAVRNEVIQEANKNGIGSVELYIEELENRGDAYEPSPNRLKILGDSRYKTKTNSEHGSVGLC